MEIRLFRNWWLMSIKGFLAIGFGIVMLILRFSLIRSSVAQIFGILLLLSGILIITGGISNIRSNPRWRWWLFEGLVDVIIGAVFIFETDIAKAFFLYFMAIWAFSTGIIGILTSFRMRIYMDRWWLLLYAGIFSILFAFLVFINPFYAKYNLGTTIGIACIIFGLIMFYVSRVLRNIYL